MPHTYVALDLETTGLNCERDAIIEIGAVKFRDGEPIDEFSALVNPGRPIPYEIQVLTGITDLDVAGQPPFSAVEGPILRFVGQLPVVAHNASFDLGFMRARGLLLENVGLDTWELASILLPNRSSYSLSALVQDFGIRLENHHRALSDAYAAGHLFRLLNDCARRLPRAVLAEITRLAHGSNWPLAQVFAEAMGPATFGQEHTSPGGLTLQQLAPESPLWQPLRNVEPLVPREPPLEIEVAELAALLEPKGAVGRAFPGYEYRPPQVDMLRSVAGAFNQQHHMLAEAGTGTGKSLAYLLPAIAYAVKNGTRVVISTNTINLQDQLYRKDLPDLQTVLGEAWHRQLPFRSALLKGRSNYLCPRRFAAFKNRPNLGCEELRGIARILVWLPVTQTGDQSEVSLPTPADRFVWSQVSADNESCSLDRCQREQRGHCFFYRARKQAEAAHVVIVNHALLLADAAAENRVLPEYEHLIIDEAHHLEDAVTEQLSFRADSQSLGQLLGAIYPQGGAMAALMGRQPSARGSGRGASRERRGGNALAGLPSTGILGDVLACLRGSVPEELQAVIREQVVRLQSDVEAVRTRLDDYWEVLDDVVHSLHAKADSSDYDARLRITDSIRSQSVWVEIEVSWDNLGITWQTLLKRCELLIGGLQDVREGGFDLPGIDELIEEMSSIVRRLEELYAQMEAWAMKPDHNTIYWVEINAQSGRLILRSAPLHVGPLVQEHIFYRNRSVIMTSATLRTGGSFEYMRDRLHAFEADTVAVGSPFDYHASTLLYLPTDLPEPTAPGYQNAVEQTLIALGRALKGRTLALFTSYAQLRRTAQAIGPALTGAGVTVLSQSTGASRHQLLEVFKTASNTILLGTRSFWEGVDVVGPALSALVLVRLPFAVPSDPIVAARSETFEDAFYNYSVPDAILRFRQGFGRLIRSKTDRGVVVVMDRRIQTKSYGQLFLDSLPECTVHRGPLMNLASTAQQWIDGAGQPPVTADRMLDGSY